MGHAREIMDKVTSALLAGDVSAIRELYAEEAVAESPDIGRLVGRDAIAEYLIGFIRAFPDMRFEFTSTLDAGDTAVDEGYLIGTNTGPLATPDGELPATGRSIRVRECDVLAVRDGLAVEHRFYYDQLEFMAQLGLGDQQPLAVPDQQSRARSGADANR